MTNPWIEHIKNKMIENYNRSQDLSNRYYNGQINSNDLYSQISKIQSINKIYETASYQIIDKEI